MAYSQPPTPNMRPAQAPHPRPGFRPPQQQQQQHFQQHPPQQQQQGQQQHPNLSRPTTPGQQPMNYRPMGNGPRPANSPVGMPRPPLSQDPNSPLLQQGQLRRPSAAGGPIPGSPSNQRPPMAGSHPMQQQPNGAPLQRPPPIGVTSDPGQAPGTFMGQGQQGVPGSPAMNPMGYHAGPPNGQNRSQPPTPKLQHQQHQQPHQGLQPPYQQQTHQQQQQQQQQQQPHQQHQHQQGHQGQDLGAPNAGLMAGPPTPTPQAGAHKPKRMYPTGINAYTESTPGLQPLAGQPLQPNMNQLAGQMGAMNVGSTGFGAQGISPMSTVALMGTAPKILDLDAPPPAINLPETASITQSPYANCDPSYKRSTLNAIPATSQLLTKSRLPFGLVITPYRSVKEGEEPVPVVSDSIIARCRRCRTYINPFVKFVEGGQRWKCNMCYTLNEVPSSFDYDSQTQQPVDRWQRKELNHAVVEYIAPTEYMVRPPQPLVYMFVIDVSYPAIQCGMVATAATTILESLDRIPNDEGRTKVGIITVDSSIHFYNLNTTSGEPQMLVVSDLEEAYLPQPQDLLCNLSECRATLEALLNRMSDMFKDTQNVGNALGPALNSAYKLISPIGGKILCLQASLPNLETGTLKMREDPKLLGTSKESTLLQAASSFYKSFAVECSKSQVCVDMFLFGSQYSDVATLSCLPRFTGGSTFFYPAFTAAKSEDALKFAHELAEFLSQRIALEAVMRVRASKGLRMSAFYGNFFVRSTDLLSLPNVPRDQSYSIEVSYDDNLTIPIVCFQTALLHTSSSGERRIRVLTLAVPVTTSLSELYMSADQVAISTLLACKAVERGMNSKLDDARDALTNKVVDILGVYKTHMTASSSGATPNLQVCDNLKLLPLLTLGMLKHVALRGGSQIPSDLRAYAMHLLSTLPSQCLIPFVHPRFYSLHDMPEHCGTIGADGIEMPQAMNLSSERLTRSGLYMLEDGQNIFLWIGRDAVPQLCMDLFGVPNYESVRGGKTTLPTLESDFNQRVNLIVGKTREMRRTAYYPQLYIVKEDGDAALRLWFLSHLIEDRAEPIMSYYQYLGHLKDRVNSGSF
ncbi:COPII subunit [Mortierella alpina]|uniref:COPII subunit n=1 Tax=Mortierella alpina TaxID=64518 RepID=A0A9P6M078_MORAP|nr:COPII subunit [Mortierella alpina]